MNKDIFILTFIIQSLLKVRSLRLATPVANLFLIQRFLHSMWRTGMPKKSGKKPKLLEGVTVTKASMLRIMELQQQGYAYVRPWYSRSLAQPEHRPTRIESSPKVNLVWKKHYLL